MKRVICNLFLLLFFMPAAFSQNECLTRNNFAAFIMGKWEGRFTQYSCGVYDVTTMVVEVEKAKGHKIEGYFIYPDYPAIISMKGKLKKGKLFLYEKKLITGDGTSVLTN